VASLVLLYTWLTHCVHSCSTDQGSCERLVMM